MGTSTYEQIPLGPPSPKPLVSPITPITPITPVTPIFEKVLLTRKLTTTGYMPTRQELDEDPLERLQKSDDLLKRRIRTLKVVSRFTAACLSLAVMVPLAITLNKFLSTNNQYRTVTNESMGGEPVRRTAWALKSSTWSTYLYFCIAVVSLTFNLTIMVSYLHGIKTANKAASIATMFSSAVLILNLVIWSITASLYKQQAVVTTDGKHNDLWGWTCSPAAKLLQPVFNDQINFTHYCNIQTSSWIMGLVQVGSMLLSLLLYFLAVRRIQSKKAITRTLSARNTMIGS